MGLFYLTVFLIFVFCIIVVLIIAGGLSDDQETGILKEIWYTFFGDRNQNE
ncbi:MAG: hypothetical protein GYB66_01490 [Chloroflexi bacterium]|nr:hypothetical protein [Chloroflexota bacterium]